MIYKEINFTDYLDAFRAHDRLDRFSYNAHQLIFDYLDDLSNVIEENIELDVIAICCEYEEMGAVELTDSYDDAPTPREGESISDEDYLCRVEEWLSDHTRFIGRTDNGTFVFSEF